MIRRVLLARTLGATSLAASCLAAGLVFLWIHALKQLTLWLVLGEVILAVTGLATGVAALIASRGRGRVPLMAILGCLASLPVLFIGFILSLFVLGGA
jgi:hypothetical protein